MFSVGALAGMLAGLLGIGGGMIIVPLLAIVFAAQGVDASVLMHVAVGTSLGTIVITSLASTRAHQKRGAVVWATFRQIAPAIIVGSLFGAWVARQIPGAGLKLMFAWFMLLVAAQMAMGMASKPHRQLPGTVGMSITGTLIGIVSAIMGIGGGSMSVPFLTYCNMAVKNAVATSAAIGVPIAVSGAIGFVISGWGVMLRPEMSFGYINLPAFFGIVVASTLFAPLGARLAHSLPDIVLKRFFAVFLGVLGLKLLLG